VPNGSALKQTTVLTAGPVRLRRLVRGVAMVLLGLSLGGCSGLGDVGSLDGLNFTKWFSDDKPEVDQPADRLYNEGLFLLNNQRNPKAAVKKFEEVDRQHPYSEWARKALLMSAYANYEAGNYDECIAAAKRYTTLHPGSQDAAYANYLIAASYNDQIPDVSRDQAQTEKALAALDEVMRRYPGTPYAAKAKEKVQFARDQLAGKEMAIGRYYLNRKDYTGAINRFKVVVTKYQTTRQVEEALERLTEAYMALGIVREAQTAAAVLGHNFPDSDWYKRAYALVKSRGVLPDEDKGSWISKAFRQIGVDLG
jgi:outer membrane protein assembly factor BamD